MTLIWGTGSYTYNNRNELMTQTDNKGQKIRFAYDDIGRLIEKRLDNPAGADPLLAEYQYDAHSYSIGKRTRVKSYTPTGGSSSTLEHTRYTYYNDLGQVAAETTVFPSHQGVTTDPLVFRYYYTQGGLMDQIEYPDGERVTTQYYWLTGQAKGSSGTSVYVQPSTEYNEAGLMTRVNFASARHTTFDYDNGYRLLQMSSSVSGAPTFNYWHDGNNNIVRIRETIGSSFSQDQIYNYDSLDRLTRARTTGSSAGSYDQRTYYDAVGNITRKYKVGVSNNYYGYGQNSGINPNAAIHAVTHLNNSQKFWYDANGNMTTRKSGSKTWTQTWTPENMLETATDNLGNSVGMKYDADGQLVLRVENGGTKKTVILGDGLYERTWIGSNAGDASKRYLFNGQAVAQREGSLAYFYVNDHLGGVAAMFGATGGATVVRRDAWGKERSRSGTLPVGNYLYTGQRWDELLGLYDYNARYYDAELGRFISADTIVPMNSDKVSIQPLATSFAETNILNRLYQERAGLIEDLHISGPINPQALSRFTYTLNAPQKYIDPTGHAHEDPIPEPPNFTTTFTEAGGFYTLSMYHDGDLLWSVTGRTGSLGYWRDWAFHKNFTLMQAQLADLIADAGNEISFNEALTIGGFVLAFIGILTAYASMYAKDSASLKAIGLFVLAIIAFFVALIQYVSLEPEQRKKINKLIEQMYEMAYPLLDPTLDDSGGNYDARSSEDKFSHWDLAFSISQPVEYKVKS